MEDPTVQVKFSEYQKLREDLKQQQARIYELEKEVADTKLADTSGTTKLLHDAFHNALKIVQFAVGNLAPETVVGWPHADLIAVAAAIEKIPGMDTHIKEVPIAWREFAQLAVGFEEQRKQRKATQVVTMATAADFGPQTAEAAAVHAAYDQHRRAEGVTPGAAPGITPPSTDH